MANFSALNPVGYLVDRQYSASFVIKNKLFRERLAHARNLYRKDLLAHYGCVNAIEFSEEGELLVSGGDDRRVLLWSVAEAVHGRCAPVAMQTTHISNIFCLAFDSANSKIFSGGNDDQVIIHDLNTGNLVLKLPHRKPVYGMSVNPQNDHLLATAGDDGRVLLFDLREAPNTDVLCLAKQKTGFHSVMFNPNNPRWLTTANSEEGIALWDCRKPKEIFMHYDSKAGPTSGISAFFNSDGSRILALRRRLPPVLYATDREGAVCQFYHPQYYNSCTMKTCCFAGDRDEYVLSGSDDFNLYMWRIAEDSEWGGSHLVLRDHRSIVNQVRYNKHNKLIASSGVEKMIKLWSPVLVGGWKGSLFKERTENMRTLYSHEDYVNLVGHSGERISHDYSDHSTMEDSKMMAFFDSLIQREIEGWDTTSDNSASSDSGSDCHEQDLLEITSRMYCNGRGLIDDFRKQKPNRIAQLIAKKRHKLAKMAHAKSSSSVLRGKLKDRRKRREAHKLKGVCKSYKHHKASNSVSAAAVATGAPAGGNGLSGRTAAAVPAAAREPQPQPQPRRRHHHHRHLTERKYRTRQSLREMCQAAAAAAACGGDYDAPSTSTGITRSTGSVYRVIQQDSDDEMPPAAGAAAHDDGAVAADCEEEEDDNDDDEEEDEVDAVAEEEEEDGEEEDEEEAEEEEEEEEEEDNLVNILPTPLNGTHDMYINVLEMAAEAAAGGQPPVSAAPSVVTVRGDEYGGHASTSNGVVVVDRRSSSSSGGGGRRGSGYTNGYSNGYEDCYENGDADGRYGDGCGSGSGSATTSNGNGHGGNGGNGVRSLLRVTRAVASGYIGRNGDVSDAGTFDGYDDEDEDHEEEEEVDENVDEDVDVAAAVAVRGPGGSSGARRGVKGRGGGGGRGGDSDTDSDYGCGGEFETPVKKRRTASASDSGCATGPGSSCSPYGLRPARAASHHQPCSSGRGSATVASPAATSATAAASSELGYEKFHRRAKKARVNLRRQIAADSDSN